MDKEYKIKVFVGIILLIMFCVFMFVMFSVGYNLKTDPCSQCAKFMGKDVSCSMVGPGGSATRNYYQNGTIEDKVIINKQPQQNTLNMNFSIK